ncbi:hypothetical protein TRFO_33323 [Tritrichomonas foetus]|uniref:Uncharacterized protein n=1 Tax=Tritrichomonas foetus TaxID=1144522 RepID=A0A1J4JLT2_9EUKA|nr:hypothetical protein TRFO_33323 [Tritrichomonas foetus]|eukprot:OHT00043.1 hypothetical protein TRFO_33323 [Tritrichomonas foetus]
MFSCSNYCDSYSNECCYGFVDSESQVKIYQMNPLPTLKRNFTVFKNTRREFLAQNCENRGQLPLAMNVPGMIFLNTLKIPGRRSYSPSHSSASTTMVRKRVNYIGFSNMGANTSARGRTNSAKEVSIISPKIDHLKRLSLHLSVAPPKIFHSRANSSRIIDFKI